MTSESVKVVISCVLREAKCGRIWSAQVSRGASREVSWSNSPFFRARKTGWGVGEAECMGRGGEEKVAVTG